MSNLTSFLARVKATANPADPVPVELELMLEVFKIMNGETSTLINNLISKAQNEGNTSAVTFFTELRNGAAAAITPLSPVVHSTMDPDIDFDSGVQGTNWDFSGTLVDVLASGESLTLLEDTTFNEITLALATANTNEADEFSQAVVKIYDFDGAALGTLRAVSSIATAGNTWTVGDLGGADPDLTSGTPHKFHFKTTSLPAGRYMAVVESRVKDVKIVARTGSGYSGGKMYDIDLTNNNAVVDDWGTPDYVMYLVMRNQL